MADYKVGRRENLQEKNRLSCKTLKTLSRGFKMNQNDRTDFAKCFAATCLVYDVSPNTDKANAYFFA